MKNDISITTLKTKIIKRLENMHMEKETKIKIIILINYMYKYSLTIFNYKSDFYEEIYADTLKGLYNSFNLQIIPKLLKRKVNW